MIQGPTKPWQDRYANNEISKFNALNKVKESYASFNTNRSHINQKSRAQRKRLDFNMSNREAGFTELTPLKKTDKSLFAQNNYSSSAVQTCEQNFGAKRFYTTVNGAESSLPVAVAPKLTSK